MAEQTQTATCGVCAGPATKRKQRANESSDNYSHLWGRGGSNPCSPGCPGPPASSNFYTREIKNFRI
ncbi:hypothetical protein FEU66_24725 [Escherichia coli]|nr:hypothetical protein [Escherichia coli]EFD0882719.1 hypothetical protein [Escherichia coli]